MGWTIKQNMSREIGMDLHVGADVRDRPREKEVRAETSQVGRSDNRQAMYN